MAISLNLQQQSAVEHFATPLLVLAGAGSGKTRVIIQKIEWIIRHSIYPCHHIAAITFTNKAAREMKQRITETLGNEVAKSMMISTFHTLGLSIIRQEYKALHYKRSFTIFDSQDTITVIKELAKEIINNENDDEIIKQTLWRISRWKNDLISSEQAIKNAQDNDELVSAQLYQQYNRQLKAYNAFDFDDLIMHPVLLLQNNVEIRHKWQAKIRYMLVDEYQDTNTCQYELIRLLAGINGGLTAVGDDDQSIYAWRGAKPENIHQLSHDYPTLTIIKLEQNYRSTDRILKTANQLIANNPHLIEKKLWSALGQGEMIKIMPCRTVNHECEKVITEIMKRHFQHQGRWKDFAILYRSNHQSRPLEGFLRQNRIPYQITGGKSFFEQAEIKDILAYLRLIANPNDDSAFLRIINVPKREIGTRTLEKLGEYASSRAISLFYASQELGFSNKIKRRTFDRLTYFTHWISTLTKDSASSSPSQVIHRIINDTSYDDWLKDNSQSPASAKRRNANISELIEWTDHLHDDGKGKATITDIVNHMALVDMLERNNDNDNEDSVNLMTLHAAKGLEFPFVFIIGVEEEILPHVNSIDNTHRLQEERRLAYVGITRAKKELFISYAKTRKRFGEEITCEKSRFLEELPEEHCTWLDKQHQQSHEDRQKTAQTYLPGIMDLLN